MALKSTIFKAELEVTDYDREYYASHSLTLARHPSETDERMMVRLLAFAFHAEPSLAFGAGLSSSDEADLWQRDLTGAILLWIDVGLPEAKVVRRAAGRSAGMMIYAFGRAADPWWAQNRGPLELIDKLAVRKLAPATTQGLSELAARSMNVRFTVQDGEAKLWVDERAVSVGWTDLKAWRLPAPRRR
jgi:uncharacterized protein YaeQ